MNFNPIPTTYFITYASTFPAKTFQPGDIKLVE